MNDAVSKVLGKIPTPPLNKCMYCGHTTNVARDLHVHVISTHDILLQCKHCNVLQDTKVMEIHKRHQCDHEAVILEIMSEY